MTFNDLGLAQPLLNALEQEGYTSPTPIQAKSIPDLMAGRDLLGIAQTGTGKTAAFALPILHALSRGRDKVQPYACRALILAPTRELAAQIEASFKTYGRHTRLSVASVFGGIPVSRNIRALTRGVDVLVATPGRLIDLIEQRALVLDQVGIFVLDEADQMLDLGFFKAIRRIVSLLPKVRQNLFFSATMPREIAGLAAELLRDPVRVEVAPIATTAERVEQRVIHLNQNAKTGVLSALLQDPAYSRVLVFSRTKHGADKIARGLSAANHESVVIHGNKSQANRQQALAAFKAGKVRVMIATDIAARGIDIDNVTHVVNYDLPNVPESYVHRIGRTARAGNAGISVSFCAPDERAFLRQIERLTRQVVPVVTHALSHTASPAVPNAPRHVDARQDRAGQRPAAHHRADGPRHGARDGQRDAARPSGGRPPRFNDTNAPRSDDRRSRRPRPAFQQRDAR